MAGNGRRKSGADPDFPFLDEFSRVAFPEASSVEEPGIGASGANLSPGMLLSAYEQGYFPWYSPGEPILWWCPEPRFVLHPADLHISESMRKVLKKGAFEVRFDADFPGVVRACASAPREGQNGTWISPEVEEGYGALHRLGWAHSSEAYLDGELAGGCYGIRLGKAFFGESMFSRASNASKAAFLTLARALFADGVSFIDCQVHTDHLESLGARNQSRESFIRELAAARFSGGAPEGAPGQPGGPGQPGVPGQTRPSPASDEADRRGRWRLGPGGILSVEPRLS